MKNRRAAVAALSFVALAGLTLAGCGSEDGSTASGGDGLTVAASFYPLAFVTERVAGDHATVDNLTQAGGEPHDLELTARQVGEISDADLVVYLAGFQPSVDEAVEQNAEDRAVDVAGLVELLDEPAGEHGDEHAEDEHADEGEEHTDEHAEEEGHEGHEHGDLAGDPHIWLDPTNLEPIADAVADRLAEADPDDADDYRANADALKADLETLDGEFETGLAQCTQRVFVVAHEAFGYLAHRYDLEQVGISGIDPEAEPSPERLAEVHDVVQAEGVTTIFYERLVSPDVAETLAADLGVQAAVLDPIEGLTDDTADQDYFSLMRANLEALRTANGCS
ncbi:metal ABC transporter substrate-binding protein [Jiangella rhizosphaerae]|uniref:Zinc ABC transporter substrate-binding protein n=1 Tax=Jiangella rhizosphaerae TaxID=2293569 RepID=A0A418KQ03_9ACTN|nr:metal ABC transporter substrate-binding protein [Jiangella rhizosphaerae]RIQ21636.1 zinc ABC transporter substrate-binding protein [Jiangella rhizosphaerae]